MASSRRVRGRCPLRVRFGSVFGRRPCRAGMFRLAPVSCSQTPSIPTTSTD